MVSLHKEVSWYVYHITLGTLYNLATHALLLVRSSVELRQLCAGEFVYRRAFLTALSTMTKFAGILLAALAIGASFFFEVTKGADKNEAMQDIYTASWAVEIMKGGDKMADTIASRYGFQNIGKVQ